MKVLAVNLMFAVSADQINDYICPADYPLAGDDPTGAHQAGTITALNKWGQQKYNTYCCKKIKASGECDFDDAYQYCNNDATLARQELSTCDDYRELNCPETHPWVYSYDYVGDSCCSFEPSDIRHCVEDNGDDAFIDCPVFPQSGCQDHPNAGLEETGLEEETFQGCPEHMPVAFSYYGEYDYCCSDELDDGICAGDYMRCGDPPCENHPTVEAEDEEVKQDPDEGCDEDYRYFFYNYGSKKCCEHEPEDDSYYKADYHQICRSSGPFTEEEQPELSVGELSCPQCWTLNAEKSSCVLSDTTCFEISCNAATLSFAFFPKMFGQGDLSHNFGITGLEANSVMGKFKYSKGLGTNGQTVVVDGDEMVFSISLSTSAREERLIEEKVVDGSKLVVQTGKLQFGKLEVEFQCRVPLVTEVQSDLFTVNSDDEVKTKQLAGDKLISLTGDLAPTFSLDLFKDAAYLEAISASNLKLGDVVYFTIKWSNTENDQVQFFAQDCQIVDGLKEVAIIKDTCLAAVVETTSLGTRYNKKELKFSYKSFAVDSMPASSSKTQTLKCSLKLCKNADCPYQMTNTVNNCPSVSGFTYVVA